jgi:hypothetical protein
VCRSNTTGVNINETGVGVQAPPETQPETLANDVVIRGLPTETPENPAMYLFIVFSPSSALPCGLIYSIKSVS